MTKSGGVHDVQPSLQQQQQPPIGGPYDKRVGGVHDVQPLQLQQQAQAPPQQQEQWRCDLGTVDELDDCFEVAGVPKDIHRRRVPADPSILLENIWLVIIGV